jgi:hypothetical protein
MTDPVRAHLLIGPLASGKTTVARRLVERLQARGVQARRVAITEEYEKPVKRYEEPDVLQYFLILERIGADVPGTSTAGWLAKSKWWWTARR